MVVLMLKGGETPVNLIELGNQIPGFKAITLDVDNTIYHHPEYHQNGVMGELEALHRVYKLTREIILNARQELTQTLGEKPSLSYTLYYTFDVDKKWWDEIRNEIWQPEKYLQPNYQLVERVIAITQQMPVAFFTNSPRNVGLRILKTLGFNLNGNSSLRLFGPEDSETCKPDPRGYMKVADLMGFRPELLIHIGDDNVSDGFAPIRAGYIAALVVHHDELPSVLETIYQILSGRGK